MPDENAAGAERAGITGIDSAGALTGSKGDTGPAALDATAGPRPLAATVELPVLGAWRALVRAAEDGSAFDTVNVSSGSFTLGLGRRSDGALTDAEVLLSNCCSSASE